MKKVLIKDIAEFRNWQFTASNELDDEGQRSISTMDLPRHFPVVIVWSIVELINYETRTLVPYDVVDYEYIYIDSFPMKVIKNGTYIYQMVRTDERFRELMDR